VKIKSEHVARVTDVGRLENGVPYMVMEYLDGRDLSTWVAQYGPMTVDRAVDFLLQACEAIAEAHASDAGGAPARLAPRSAAERARSRSAAGRVRGGRP
jgi:serine/threonine protein kinase